MFHDNENVSKLEERMLRIVRNKLDDLNIEGIAASDVAGTGDFLSKILSTIQGCGQGIAVYSDMTPSRTLANIFFEVGICQLLGKPVHLVVTGENPTPSDFVRSEWIKFETDQQKPFESRLTKAFRKMLEHGEYLRKLGDIALDAENLDHELAFERFKQAILLNGSNEAQVQMSRLQTVVRTLRKNCATELKPSTERLMREIDSFLKLLPA